MKILIMSNRYAKKNFDLAHVTSSNTTRSLGIQLIQSCVARLAYEKPLELDYYANPTNFFPFWITVLTRVKSEKLIVSALFLSYGARYAALI